MYRFRLMLSLLLCLTVPAAAWASVLHGAFCAKTYTHLAAAADDDHDTVGTTADDGSIHHDDSHCVGAHDHGHPCKGDHCDCGCGLGLCSSTSHALLNNGISTTLLVADSQSIPNARVSGYTDFTGGSPLRPPIA